MRTVEESLVVNAPREALFDLAQDYDLRLEWDPFLRDMRFLDGATEARVGVKVWVRAWTGLTMVVEYVALDRPGVVAMRMLDGPFFLGKFAGSWRFLARSAEGERVEVVFRYTFETRWPWLRWPLDSIAAWVFRRDVRARLRGLKRAAEEDGLLGRLGSNPDSSPDADRGP